MYHLDEEMRSYVNMFDPKILNDAYSLAKVQEFTLNIQNAESSTTIEKVEIAKKNVTYKVFDEMLTGKFDRENSNSAGETLIVKSKEDVINLSKLDHRSEYQWLQNHDNKESVVSKDVVDNSNMIVLKNEEEKSDPSSKYFKVWGF